MEDKRKNMGEGRTLRRGWEEKGHDGGYGRIDDMKEEIEGGRIKRRI